MVNFAVRILRRSRLVRVYSLRKLVRLMVRRDSLLLLSTARRPSLQLLVRVILNHYRVVFCEQWWPLLRWRTNSCCLRWWWRSHHSIQYYLLICITATSCRVILLLRLSRIRCWFALLYLLLLFSLSLKVCGSFSDSFHHVAVGVAIFSLLRSACLLMKRCTVIICCGCQIVWIKKSFLTDVVKSGLLGLAKSRM